MRRTLTRIALMATAAAILRVNSEAASTLTANPTSDQEFPAPAIPLTSTGAPRPFAFGTATFTLNDAMTSLAFTATIFNLDLSGIQTPNDDNDNLTAAHIHAGPTVGPAANGPVVWGFFGASLNDNNPNDLVVTPFVNGVGGTLSGKWDLAEGNGTTLGEQLPNILGGHSYINFHTTQFPGGEIRGAIVLNVPGVQPFSLFAQTLPATATGAITNRLNGRFNPAGTNTSVWFEWGTTTNYGNLTPTRAIGSGTSNTNWSEILVGVEIGITYHFRAVASNGLGIARGSNLSFTTPVFTTWPDASNSALEFDGTDDRVQAGTGLFSNVTNSFTIELWANPTGFRTLTAEANSGVSALAQRFAVFPEHGDSSYGAGHAGAGLSIGFNGISVFEHAHDHLPSLLVYPDAISGWTHVALVYANHTPQLYVNGTLVRTGMTSAIPFIHPSASLGTWAIDYGTYQGQLDEVRIWDAPLSQAQIQANMNRSLAGTESNLVVYYRCDEGTGVVVVDHAPAAPSADGTLIVSGGVTNGPVWVPSGIQPFSPFAETLPATAAGDFTNRLNGLFNPAGADTRVWFEWGTNINYGNLTPDRAIGSDSGNTNWSEVLGGLENNVTYHFRAVASNAFGVALGANLNFTTPPAFSDIGAGLLGVSFGSVAWGDYDNDGRLDILLTGEEGGIETPRSQVWRNTGSAFSNSISFGLWAVSDGSAAWGDYNNDGLLDIAITGFKQFLSDPFAAVFQNTNGLFYHGASLTPVGESSVAWGDYDNDGRLDLMLTGYVGAPGGVPVRISQIFRNFDNSFANINAGLPGVDDGSVAWGDYDNDGRLDILVTGATTNGSISQIWRNTGSGFTNINAGLPPGGSVAWGDYDNDGRLDILLTGGSISQVWRNTGTGFTDINAGLPAVLGSSVAWGDYDNDGRLDFLLAGATTNGFISQIWRNTGSGFVNINAGLPGVGYGSAAWGDYDNDGRLDILLMGINSSGRISQIWRNNTALSNSPPTVPTGLHVTLAGDVGTFTWNATTDAQTPASGLTYNLRVGTTPGGGEIVGPMAANNGLRRLPRFGNAQHNLSRTISGLPLGQQFYWSVQAVDSAFAGSPFAAETSFTLNTVFTPPNGIPIPGDINGDGVVDEAELNIVLTNYFPNSSFLLMTNVAGLGGTNVTFGLSNATTGAFSVEYTTNLLDWLFLGPATPRYEFNDINAPAEPQRYYRLRWP